MALTSMLQVEYNSQNVGLGFGLTILAGLATTLGASVVFFPSMVKLASRKVLAAGLGFSAGVLLYSSFSGLFFTSIASFEAAGVSPHLTYAYASASFMGGALVMVVIDKSVHFLLRFGRPKQSSSEVPPTPTPATDEEASEPNQEEPQPPDDMVASVNTPLAFSDELENPAMELEEWQRKAREEVERNQREDKDNSQDDVPPMKPKSIFKRKIVPPPTEDEQAPQPPLVTVAEETSEQVVDDDVSDSADSQQQRHYDKRHIRMGFPTALAMALHNVPEGMATFVATLGHPQVGIVLAISTCIHNIPEGLCVAMPIYYATDNRCQAFLWGLWSGLTEPLAAIVVWLILSQTLSNTVYAVVFGMTAGMMVIISMKQLLPTAHRYDDHDGIVTYAIIAGMLVMALTLVFVRS